MTAPRLDKWRIRAGGGRGRLSPASVPRPDHRHGRTSGRRADGRLTPLRRHPFWTALGLLIAVVAAGTRFATIGIVPPSVKLKPFAHANASTQVVVGREASVTHPTANVNDTYDTAYPPRSYALADMVASPEVRQYVAQAAGVPASKIGVLEPLWTELARSQQWADGPKRASQITIEKDPYQIALSVEGNEPPWSPVIDVATQAPSTEMAAKLATAVDAGLNKYLLRLQTTTGVPAADRYRASQLAPVSVIPASRSQLLTVAVFVFLAVFILCCAVVLACSSLARDLRDAATLRRGASDSRSSYMLQDR